ncbi:gamma-tubulin complex component 2-like [Ornithodoros turicata]|uniref:gamma-tubulin complex component 2-like n=1 Tax=Ornithodoros turicata TaxID=34597 RepID=UPI0031390583
MERARQNRANKSGETEKQNVNNAVNLSRELKDEKQRQVSTIESGSKNRRKKDVDQNKQNSISSYNGSERKLTPENVSRSSKSEYTLRKEDILKLKEEIQESATEVRVGLLSSSYASSITVVPGQTKIAPTLLMNGGPHASWDFSRSFDRSKVGPIGALPVSTQEYVLLEDLLYCLVGVDGSYIKALPLTKPYGIQTFSVDETADPALHQLVKKVLQLCSCCSIVTRFIEANMEYNQGMVNQALATAMELIMRDHTVLVTQLEHHLVHLRNLTLHKMWFYVQPALSHMETLASVATAVLKGKCFGGRTLGVLHEKATSLTGDSRAREICLHLAKAASVPYFEMIEKWIYQGQIRDVYKEFLVADGNQVTKDDVSVDNTDNYWNTRYTLVHEMVPTFLNSIAEKILTTGKYRNVIRQCATGGKSIELPKEHLCYSVNEREYSEKIDSTYGLASRTLLNLLMRNLDLMGRLRSVKQYFLMEQADFVVQFMDMADEELSYPISNIVPTRLELLLQLALSTSVVSTDRYKDSVKHQLLEWSLLSQMSRILTSDQGRNDIPSDQISGYEAFTLNYDIEWPLNLVLSTSSLGCYQMIFRYLFYCRHVERMLTKVWLLDKSTQQSKSLRTHYTAAFGLRHRMLHFVQNLACYSMVEVIEPNWHIFHSKMQEVQTVDAVLELHTDFLDTCMVQCMLTNYGLLHEVYTTLRHCLDFATYVLARQASNTKTQSGDVSLLVDVVDESKEAVPFQKQVDMYQDQFDSSVERLRKCILDCSELCHGNSFADMLHRIDFNKFYSNRRTSAAH